MTFPYVLNITANNVRQYAREQYERDSRDGPTSIERAHEINQQFREHCMSGEVMAAPAVNFESKVKQFVELHLQHRKDAEDVAKYLETNAGTDVFVRVGEQLYTITKNYGASYELPVNIRKAVVIGD